jgi:hypothetical protein
MLITSQKYKGKPTPLPPISDPNNPLPVDVKIIEENGKKYKVTYYANGASNKEEIV